MKKAIYIFGLVGIFILSNFTITHASNVETPCRLTGKITEVTNDHVYFVATGKSLIDLFFKAPLEDKCLPYNITYRFPRPLRTIFLKDQKVYIELDVISAMGPDGAIPSWDSWRIRSEVDAARPFNVEIQPEKVGESSVDIKQIPNSTDTLIQGKIYTVAELVTRSEQQNQVTIYLDGYVVGINKCTEYEIKNKITGCGPDGMLTVSPDSTNKGTLITIIQDYQNPVNVNSIKIGSKYRLKIKTGGLSGGSLVLVSIEPQNDVVSKDTLIEGQTYTINQLKNLSSISNLNVKTVAFVSKIDWCDPRSDAFCPQNIFITDDMSSDYLKDGLAMNFGFYEYGKIKPLNVGGKYEFILRYSAAGNNYNIASAKKLANTNIATSTPEIQENIPWPGDGDIAFPPQKKFIWWNPFTWFGR